MKKKVYKSSRETLYLICIDAWRLPTAPVKFKKLEDRKMCTYRIHVIQVQAITQCLESRSYLIEMYRLLTAI